MTLLRIGELTLSIKCTNVLLQTTNVSLNPSLIDVDSTSVTKTWRMFDQTQDFFLASPFDFSCCCGYFESLVEHSVLGLQLAPVSYARSKNDEWVRKKLKLFSISGTKSKHFVV